MKMKIPTIKETPATVFYFVLLALGVLFYFAWGVAFGVWIDVGVYSVVVVLCGFGIVGLHLYSYMATQEEQNMDDNK